MLDLKDAILHPDQWNRTIEKATWQECFWSAAAWGALAFLGYRVFA